MKPIWHLLVFVCAALVAFSHPAIAAPGDLDFGFGGTGIVTTLIGSGSNIFESVNGIAVQSDGKIVVAGPHGPDGQSDFAVLRYNPDGTLDTTFNGTGFVTTDFGGTDDYANSVALQGDGKIVVAGTSLTSSSRNIALARYTIDGSLDITFGTAHTGKVVTVVSNVSSAAGAVKIQPDGKIVVGGWVGFNGRNAAVLRYNPDGTLDNDFADAGLSQTRFSLSGDSFYAVGLQNDGKIVMTGSGTGVSLGQGQEVITTNRINADGTGDGSFSGGFLGIGTAIYGTGIAVQNDGKVVLSGRSFSGHFFAARLNMDGHWDTSFGGGWVATPVGIGTDIANGVAVQSDGKIVLAGFSYDANTGFNGFALVRYNTDASLDTGFHSTGKVTTSIGSSNAVGNCVAIQADGRILVAGFSYDGSNRHFTVARYFGTPQPPIVHTNAATGVTKAAATLTGTVNPNSLATTAHFEYGLTTSYGIVTPNQSFGNGTTTLNVSSAISLLTPNQTYHYRLVASNSAALNNGMTNGEDTTFTTDPDPPLAFTSDAIAVSSTGATLAGVVIPNGRDTGVYFEYGLTTAYGSATPTQSFPATTGFANVFAPVSALVAGGTYHFRIVASNSGSPLPALGEDKSFQARPPPPTVATGSASSLSTTSARVHGSVRAHNTVAQVFFDWGTDPTMSQFNSITGTPQFVAGDADTSVSADINNLQQGVIYYYRIRAVNAGNAGIGATATFALDVLSGLIQQFPGSVALGDRQGFVFVTLSPAGIGAGWRFVGEQQWRASGVVATGFTTSDRKIEFRPVPGYIQPPEEPVAIISGGAPVFLSREYFPSGSAGDGSLSVTLKPDALADAGLPEAERAQWRLLAVSSTEAGPWLNTQDTLSGLFPGNYLVECKPVAGRSTPPPVSVAVLSGQTSIPTIVYYLADSPTGTPPGVLPFETVSTSQNLPYGYVGQIRSEAGSSTGFVVRPKVVATAGHVVFDDATLSSAIDLQWLFQRDKGTYEPKPQIPRGYYLLSGYSAQRALENTPGSSSPESQVLDAASLWFFGEDISRGGFGGYLASDADNNEWLMTSPATLKTLVGYPVDGIPAASQGRMHATPPMAFAFTHPPAAGHIYATTAIRSAGGNSGGPLCVQFEGGNYYPAAIYLGGSGQTIVRAIDSNVIRLFDLAELSSVTGNNSNSGGIIRTDSSVGSSASPAQIQVYFSGSGSTLANARWNINGGSSHTSGEIFTLSVSGNPWSIQFPDVSPYLHRNPYSVTVTGGVRTTLTVPCNGIIVHPIDKTRTAFDKVGFSVTVSGTPTAYQWRRSGVDIPGAISSSISIPVVHGSDAGNHRVVVTWDNGPQTSDAGTLTVIPASQTITFPKPADRLLLNGPFNLSATSSSSQPVVFTIVSGPATLAGNGVTLTPYGIGTVVVRASVPATPNGNWAAAPDVDRSFVVSPASQTITFPKPADRLLLNGPFNLSATSSSGRTVTFAVLSGAANLSANGITLTPTGLGTVVVRASLAASPDGSYSAAPDVDQSFVVSPVAQTFTFPKPADRLMRDGAFNLSATSSSGRAVTFTILFGAANLHANGVTLTPSGPGSVLVRASLAASPDGSYSAAPDFDQNFDVGLETLTSWRGDHFTVSEFNNPLISGPAADPDNDGINNLLEFALNLDPKGNDRVTMLAGTGTRGLPLIQRETVAPYRATAEFVRRKAGTLPGITYRIEFSDNLPNPDNWSARGVESITPIDDKWERVKVTDPNVNPTVRFGRLFITQP